MQNAKPNNEYAIWVYSGVGTSHEYAYFKFSTDASGNATSEGQWNPWPQISLELLEDLQPALAYLQLYDNSVDVLNRPFTVLQDSVHTCPNPFWIEF